ncbi:MAG: Trp family transcriptional regulator [Steroidobacteraceae bacterium]
MIGERLPYSAIHRETGASVTTIGRVAKFLQAGMAATPLPMRISRAVAVADHAT